MATPKRTATAPVSPATEKKPGFLKRHLVHRRRSSSVSFPNGTPPVSPGHPPPKVAEPPKVSIESSDALSKSTSDGFSSGLSKATSDELNKSTSTGTDELQLSPMNSKETALADDTQDVPRQNSKSSNVRFAPDASAAKSPTRHRRASSTGQSRRGSIYVRIEGLHSEGVDHGVGSKARRLSIAIPAEFHVDECPLSEHFSLLSRAGKKDIGEGGAAVVKLMQSKTAGYGKDRLFAVKEFRPWEPDEEKESDYDRKIKSEYGIAKSCQHPNIVETFRLCFSDKKWFHVMEYCDLGDLNDIINKGYFSAEDRNCIFKQLLRGVEYLHSRGIAHRDLKSENLLLTKNGCLKLADFGTAEVFSGMHPGLQHCRRPSIIDENDDIRLCAPGLVGSRPYMAPEIIKHEKPYDPRAVDVWSCAIIYLTLCVGGTPWEFASTDVKNFNIFASTWDAWLEKYPDGIVQKGRELPAFVGSRQFKMLGDMGTKVLVMGMLHPDPNKRWSAKQALEDKTVVEFPCCQQEGYSDDIKTRQRKALHNHCPPKTMKGGKPSKPK